MELRHLRYFLAVAEELSFTRAAARLYVSQPSLSQQIKALEKVVGTALFERNARGINLTAAGQAMIGPARSALASVAEGVQAARENARPECGLLRVGLVYGAAGELTQPILTAFGAAFPQVQLVFHELPPGGIYTGLLDDELDLAFTRLPLDPERHAWTVLFEEPRVLGLNARHSLADAKAADLDDVLHLPMPLFDSNRVPSSISAYWLLNDYRNGNPPQFIGGPFWSVSECAHMIIHHATIVAVTIGLMRRLPPLPGQALRFIELPDVSATQVVVGHRRQDHRSVVLAFCDIAQTVAKRLAKLRNDSLA